MKACFVTQQHRHGPILPNNHHNIIQIQIQLVLPQTIFLEETS